METRIARNESHGIRRVERRHTDDLKAAAIALYRANGGAGVRGALTATARALEVPHATIQAWVNGEHINQAVIDMANGTQAELADAFERIAERAIAAVTPEKLENATFPQLMTGAGIAVDKARLLREQASPDAQLAAETARQMSVERVRARLAEFIASRRAAAVVTSVTIETVDNH